MDAALVVQVEGHAHFECQQLPSHPDSSESWVVLQQLFVSVLEAITSLLQDFLLLPHAKVLFGIKNIPKNNKNMTYDFFTYFFITLQS